jgi:hypothetical protein
VSARLPGGTTVTLLESQDGGHWLRVRAPDGTTGWLIDKYVVPAGQGDAAATGELCPLAAPSPDAAFIAAEPAGTASLPGETRRLGVSGDLVVVSYNLWELYDGRDGDSYLGEREHPESATLDPAHAARRVAALAAPLAGLSADVFVFQEVENAELACAVARAADERSAWRCWASDWAHEPHPQNVAVASRVAGTVVLLDPGEGMGQRGALELAVDGTALRIAAVHLKSSVGAEGVDDCGNAAKRMAVAQGTSSSATSTSTRRMPRRSATTAPTTSSPGPAPRISCRASPTSLPWPPKTPTGRSSIAPSSVPPAASPPAACVSWTTPPPVAGPPIIDPSS